MKYYKKQLDNGLRVVLCPLKNRRTLSVFVLTKTGLRNEDLAEMGVSHFLEHLLLKGTKKRPNKLALAKLLDGAGATHNAYTSKDTTGFYIKVNYKKLDLALDYLSDILLNSKLNVQAVENEKGVIVEEINMYEDNPMLFVHYLFENVVYGQHPLGWEIAGTKETVQSINRSKLYKYWQARYQSQNMVIAIAGNFDKDLAYKKINKYFKKLPGIKKKHTKKNVSNGYNPFEVTQKRPQFNIVTKNTNQVQLMLGFPTFSILNDKMKVLSLLTIILGGNSSSRLFTVIRGKLGLCYSVYSSVTGYEDVSNVYIKAGLNKDKIDQAVIAILGELKKIKDRGVSAEELKRANDYIEGILTIRMEDSSFYASHFAEQELFENKIESIDKELKALKSIKPAQIKKVAQEVFIKEHLNIAAIGDVNIEKLKKLVKKIKF